MKSGMLMIKGFSAFLFIFIYTAGSGASYSQSDFVLGDKKQKITALLKTKKYTGMPVYYENNGFIFEGLPVASSNSIKIIIPEREHILLVFSEKNILIDIYICIEKVTLRDMADYRMEYTSLYGNPAEETDSNGKILAWKKGKTGTYVIFRYNASKIIINIRDTSLCGS